MSEDKDISLEGTPETPHKEDEIHSHSADNTVEISKTKSKPKKRKKQKDDKAPKQPLTGYVRFLNDRRDLVRSENPNLSFAEITKLLASEWTNLPSDRKQQYLDAAERDKERYTQEYNAYKQTEAYKVFLKQQSDKKQRKEEDIKQVPSQPQMANNKETVSVDSMESSNCDIPIFTEEFLDHNKIRDTELRHLRKSNTDYEQQNSVLQQHIENMKKAIEKLEGEISQQKKSNVALEELLENLRSTLSHAFSRIKLPGLNETANIKNIDNYMTHLHSVLLENNTQDAALLKTIRGILAKMEFNG